MDLQLTDRVFVVTGGSRGLGFAGAEALVAEGARVVVSSRSEAAVAAAVARLGGDRAAGVVGDLADPTTPDRCVDLARARFGRLDGGLVSVGGPPAGGVMTLTDGQWETAFATVFLGAVRFLRTLAAELEAGGSLAAVLSTSVKQPLGGLAASNGLRPGLGMLVKTLADEIGPRGVRVNGLLPGRFDTDRVRELDAATGDPARARAAHEQAIPLRRYGRPEEFAALAAFVLSPRSSYLTGAVLAVDGGSSRAL